jgi:chromosome segregation ATPase
MSFDFVPLNEYLVRGHEIARLSRRLGHARQRYRKLRREYQRHLEQWRESVHLRGRVLAVQEQVSRLMAHSRKISDENIELRHEIDRLKAIIWAAEGQIK